MAFYLLIIEKYICINHNFTKQVTQNLDLAFVIFFFLHSEITLRSHGEQHWHKVCSHHASCHDMQLNNTWSKYLTCLFNNETWRNKVRHSQSPNQRWKLQLSHWSAFLPSQPHLPSLSSSAHLQPTVGNQHVFSSAQGHTARQFIATWDVPADSPVVLLPISDFPASSVPR